MVANRKVTGTASSMPMGLALAAFISLAVTLAGAAVAVGKIKRRRVYVCLLSGGIYYGILLAMTALFFGGQYQGMGVTALLVLAGSGLVALLGLRGEKGAKPRRRKIGNR